MQVLGVLRMLAWSVGEGGFFLGLMRGCGLLGFG